MGGETWEYFVPYQQDIEKALQELRQEVFTKGAFRGSEKKPETIEKALENAAECGTASILDINAVSEEPGPCTVSPLDEDDLDYYFNTTQPSHEMIMQNQDFFQDIDRGSGVYIIVYKEGKPDEIFFGGYSFD